MINPTTRTKIIFAVSLVCTVLIMSFIFMMSGQTGVVSTSESDGLSAWLASIVVPGYDALSPAEQYLASRQFVVPLRKSGHFLEYAALGLFAFSTVASGLLLFSGSSQKRTKGARPGIAFLTAVIICIAFAASDEIHQTLVPGRSGMPADVLLDSIGSSVGALIGFLVFRHIHKRNHRGGA